MSSDGTSGEFGVKFRLCMMMFLQFFIWGAWFPLVFDYLPSLGFNSEWQVPVILGTFNASALLAVFFSNQFADRNFAAQKFLAFSHLVGGLGIFGLAFIRGGWTTTVGGQQINLSFWAFFALMALHTIFYVPTISITNSIAFANLKDPQREFGFIRLWGTIGWIAAAWPFVFILAGKKDAAFREATSYTFMAAGIAALLLSAFSLVLPNTPPKAGEKLAWLEALKLLRRPFVLVLFVVTFLDAAIHQFYFYWCATFLKDGVNIPGNWIMPVMSIGQVAEIVTMAFLGYVLKRCGWRFTMVIGILGHAGRFAVFAYAQSLPLEFQQPAAIAVNVLHGICYAFFFATVYIFIDAYFPKDARASAQGLFNMLILGVGPFVSNFVSGKLSTMLVVPVSPLDTGTAHSLTDFKTLFTVPAATALVAALLLLLFFHPPAKKAEESVTE